MSEALAQGDILHSNQTLKKRKVVIMAEGQEKEKSQIFWGSETWNIRYPPYDQANLVYKQHQIRR